MRAPRPPRRRPATGRRGASPPGATSSTRTSCPSWRPATAPPIPPAALVPHDRRDPARVGRERPLVQRAERAAVPAPSAEPEGAHRLAHARPLPGRLPRDRPALGRRLRGVGARGGRCSAGPRPWPTRRPTRRPTRAACRCSTRATGARRCARSGASSRPLRGRPFVNLYEGSDEPVTVLPRGPARRTRLRPPAGAPTSARRRGFALPDPSARPTSSPREGLRWLAWSRFSGDRFFAHEGGAGAPHPQARPGRRREPQRLRLHRRVHPVGLHPPVAVRRRGGGRPLRELPGARPRRPRALQPGLRGEAALRPHGKAHADRGPGVRLLPLPADPRRPVDLDGPGAAGRGHRHQLLRLGQPALHQPAPLRRDARHRRARCAARGCRRRPPTPSSSCSTPRRARGRPSRPGSGACATARRGDALYTTYALLGELGGGAFSFDADTRLEAEPARLAARAHAVAPARRHPRRRLRPGRRRLGARGRDADRHRPGRLRAHARRGRPSRRCATS